LLLIATAARYSEMQAKTNIWKEPMVDTVTVLSATSENGPFQ
jgi:hypothetical protein